MNNVNSGSQVSQTSFTPSTGTEASENQSKKSDRSFASKLIAPALVANKISNKTVDVFAKGIRLIGKGITITVLALPVGAIMLGKAATNGVKSAHRSGAAGKFREAVTHGVRAPRRQLRTPRKIDENTKQQHLALSKDTEKSEELISTANTKITEYKTAKKKYQAQNKAGTPTKDSRDKKDKLKDEYLKAKEAMYKALEAARADYKAALKEQQPDIDDVKAEVNTKLDAVNNSAYRASLSKRIGRRLPIIGTRLKTETDAYKALATKQLAAQKEEPMLEAAPAANRLEDLEAERENARFKGVESSALENETADLDNGQSSPMA